MNLVDARPIIVVNALPKTNTILPKPVVHKEVAGKIAILPLKSKTVARKQRIRRTKKEIERERKSSAESKLTSQKKDVNDKEVNESDRNKCDNSQTEQNAVTNANLKDNNLSKDIEPEADSGRIETTEPTLPQPELSNDILASLQIPQNDSNNESLSPTAAFLMSFPVVSSAGVRIGEDEHEAHDSPSHQQSLSASKPANETNILDNISSLLTTKDYERFVEDAVKNDADTCQSNEKAVKRSIEGGQEKRVTSISFDFQLKPILNSCVELKSVSETGQKTSVTCTSTYLPEIGNLSYKSSPTKKHRKSTNEENFVNSSIAQDNLQPLTTLTRTSPVSTDEYIRHHSAMDFITSSSTILHNLEPPAKILRLSDANEGKRTETSTFENLFLRNSSTSTTYSSNSITTSNTYSTIYNYDKVAAGLGKLDSKASLMENVSFTPSIASTASRGVSVDASVPKMSTKVLDKEKHLNVSQSFAITSGTNASIIQSSQNQLNSLYSYPNNTVTYSSTAIPHLPTNTNNSKTYQDTSAKTTAPTSIDKSFFKSNHPTTSATSATDGFYTSLTSIGTTQSNLPQYPSSIMRPNMYTSALSLSSSSNQKALDYAPQTPFTFSLTTPLHTASNAKPTSLTSCQQSQNYLPPTHSTSYAQDYNPFAFENISSISAPITPYSACRETSQFSFSLTSTTNKVTLKNPSQSSFSIDNNFLTETRVKPIAPIKSEVHLDKKLSYKHCPKVEVHEELKNKESTQKVEKAVTKQHVNWMTSTTDLQKNDYPIIPPLDYTQPATIPNHYLPPAQLSNSQKNTDIYFAHPIGEENFQWSPNKLIDTPNINSTTLPNLHGDLALNSITPKPQTSTQDKSKNLKLMLPSHMQSQHNVTSNPTNSYFSVSQLVDHPKSVTQPKSYDDSVLQQKISKPSSNHSRFKQKDSKKVVKPASNVSNFTPNIFVESFAYNEPLKQNNSNNYSAEALISMHPSKKETKPISSNYANQSEYCNQLDTYNNMDYLNEPNYNYYNNSYFPQITDNEYFCSGSYSDQQFHNKSTRSTVPPTKHLTSIADTSYSSHTSQNNLYSFPHPSGKLCQQSSQYKNSTQLSTSYNQSRSYANANKKQFKQDLFPSYDPNASTNYFTPSLNINTPILPHPPLIPTPHNIPSNDDFNYTSHLNYPTSLAKTSTYPTVQQMSENNQGNLMLHGNVGGNAGNLVTNFNLSTICPEINDKTRQQNW